MIYTEQIFSILLAFLIVIIYKTFFWKNVTYHGPNSSIVKRKIYKKDGKYYRFRPQPYVCSIYISKKIKK